MILDRGVEMVSHPATAHARLNVNVMALTLAHFCTVAGWDWTQKWGKNNENHLKRVCKLKHKSGYER